MTLFWTGLVACLLIAQVLLVLHTAWTARRIRRGLPAPGRFVEIEGARIHLAEAGEGPPLLLIHGLNGSHGNFTYALFERLKPSFRLIAPDRPGCAYSDAPKRWGATLSEQAASMAALIAKLELQTPLTVVGHSLGGAVALQLAVDRPDLVSRLVLVAPLVRQPGRVAPVFYKLGIRPLALRVWFAWTLNVVHAIASRKATLQALFGPDEAPADFAIRGRSLISLLPRAYLAACRDALALDKALPDLTARLAEVRCPVSLIYGEGDRILDATSQSEALRAALPGLDDHMVSGGHMIPLTAPDAVAKVILARPS